MDERPPPGFKLFTSNRLEILAETLAGIVASQPLPPLLPEIVVVQSRGMARWLAMAMAARLGVWAHAQFPFPNAFLLDIFARLQPDYPQVAHRETIAWRLMGILAQLDGPEFAPLQGYLADGDPLKRWQLAGRLADLFDQYAIYRPDLIAAWQEGKSQGEEGWQAELWRRVSAPEEGRNRADLLLACLARLANDDLPPLLLPARIAVFGVSSLPPYHLQLFAALSRHVEVNFLVMNPCREYWADIVSEREIANFTRRRQLEAEELYLTQGNTLLASMGRLGRELFSQLLELESEEHSQFAEPEGDSLLAQVQREILDLEERGGGAAGAVADGSIVVHSCHSPLREVEVLRDQLLAMLAEPELLAKDILVMTPDIATYGPYIQAVFDLPLTDPLHIPYSVADQILGGEGRLLEEFQQALALVGGRFGVSEVLAVVESPSVAARFNLAEGELRTIRAWLAELRIGWGWDGESRQRLGLLPLAENTWRAGLERLVLGYAMAGEGDRLFAGRLPYDHFDGGDAELLGRFLQLLDTLFAHLQAMERGQTLAAWAERLTAFLADCFHGEAAEGEDKFIRGVLAELGRQQELAGFTEEVGIEVIVGHLGQAIAGQRSASGFLSGGVTFCALLPMRAVPFAVVCLLGMNDADYPRQGKAPSFDLMARAPRLGDRSQRFDDRYLFLEAILAARRRLYLSYVGQSLSDDSQQPPSVLVCELLDYLAQGCAEPEALRAALLTVHCLQPFNPDYFTGNGRLFSYSAENLAAAEALRQAERSPAESAAFLVAELAEPPAESREVSLEQLVRFFKHPAREFCKLRLGLALPERAESLEDRESFDLEGLDRYGLENELVARALAGEPLPAYYEVARAAGRLPHGGMGGDAYREASGKATLFAGRVAPFRGASLPPLAVELDLAGFRLQGQVGGIHETGALRYRCAAVKPGDRLAAWLGHLLLNSGAAPGYPTATVLIGTDLICRFAPVAASRAYLSQLLELYGQGLRRPLPFFPKSSWSYAESLARGKSEEEARAAAASCWLGNDYQAGEGREQYLQLCHRHASPLDEQFRAVARTVFAPLLAHGEEER